MVDILIKHARCISVIAAVIAFLVVPAPPAFPDVIKIDENLTSRSIGLDIEYLEDAEGTLTFDDIKGGKLKGSWTASKTENPGFGFTDSVYWVRFTVENIARREIQFYLDQNFPQADFIRLYVPENGAYRIIETGDSKPFSERPLEHRSFVFPLKLKAGAQRNVLCNDQISHHEHHSPNIVSAVFSESIVQRVLYYHAFLRYNPDNAGV